MSEQMRRRMRDAAAHRRQEQHSSSNSNEHTPLLSFSSGQQSSGWSLGSVLATPARLIWQTVTSHVTNFLLVFVPLGIVAGMLEWNSTAVFMLNFLGIVPLASLLSFATEELASVVGETIGGLLNASFGNAVELIISIIALREGKIRLVQANMIGSILSNTLLILGCCFIAGGIRRAEQSFNQRLALTMASLMAVSSAALIIPGTLYAVISGEVDGIEEKIEFLSRGTSIILLILYVLYLHFQLRSQTMMYNASQSEESEEDESEGPQILRPIPAVIALVVVTSVIAICAEFLVGSIDSIVQKAGISETFIGLILLPIVSNAAEHVTAVVVSYKNKMDLAIGVALGSGLQIPLLVTPALVLLGWAIDQPMTLRFEVFETIVFLVTTQLVNNLIHDGTSNHLEGAMCLGTYIIIALAFFVYPDQVSESGKLLQALRS